MVNRLMGDQVIGLFVPRFSGENHAQAAIDAARDLLKVTGHQDGGGLWVPVGVGVPTGPAFVSTVGHGDSVNEIAVLGNAANLAAILSSSAGQGEVLISQKAIDHTDGIREGIESRELEVKGIPGTVKVHVIKVEPQR